MGANEKEDDPKSDPATSRPGGFEEYDTLTRSADTASTNGSDERPVRRSSLRPAPPSFRPSTRDPAQLRPVMVVHAGDAEQSVPRWEIPEPSPSQTSQVRLDSVARIEPFPLAEDVNLDLNQDLRQSADQGSTLPLVIPPPAAVPRNVLELASDQPEQTVDMLNRKAPPPNDETAGRGLVAANHRAAAQSRAHAPVIPAPRGIDPSAQDRSRQNAATRSQSDPRIEPVSAQPPASASRGQDPRLWLAVVAAIVLVVGVVITMSRGPRQIRSEETLASSNRIESVAELAPNNLDGPAAAAQQAGQSRGATQATPSSTQAHNAEASPAPIQDPALNPTPQAVDGARPTSAPASNSPPNTVRVTLDVKPSDAKVVYRGSKYPGPPFVFDVPKGKRIAVEVSRFGFATRRVDIDDKQSEVSVGLMRSAVSKKGQR